MVLSVRGWVRTACGRAASGQERFFRTNWWFPEGPVRGTSFGSGYPAVLACTELLSQHGHQGTSWDEGAAGVPNPFAAVEFGALRPWVGHQQSWLVCDPAAW